MILQIWFQFHFLRELRKIWIHWMPAKRSLTLSSKLVIGPPSLSSVFKNISFVGSSRPPHMSYINHLSLASLHTIRWHSILLYMLNFHMQIQSWITQICLSTFCTLKLFISMWSLIPWCIRHTISSFHIFIWIFRRPSLFSAWVTEPYSLLEYIFV